MASDPLIVPTVLPSGSLHFASVNSDSTIQDVIERLIALDEVTTDVLGDLHPHGWGIQRIRTEKHGRRWEEEELESLGVGKIKSSFTFPSLVPNLSQV